MTDASRMMFSPRLFPFVLCALLGSVAASVAASTCSAIDDAAARACCEKSLPAASMHQTLSLTSADQRGTLSTLGADLFWKRFEDQRAHARVDLSAPPRQAGTVILLGEREVAADGSRREPEVVLYKPGERRDRLISVSALSGEMLGTDFSYEDFAYFYGTSSELRVTRLADEQWQERAVIVLEATYRDPDAAFDRGSEYERIVTRFDAEYCVPVATRFYTSGNHLRKELLADPEHIRAVAGRWVAHRLVMHDRREGSHTILELLKLDFDPPLEDRLFSRAALKRGR